LIRKYYKVEPDEPNVPFVNVRAALHDSHTDSWNQIRPGHEYFVGVFLCFFRVERGIHMGQRNLPDVRLLQIKWDRSIYTS